jgi:hypothetical protein
MAITEDQERAVRTAFLHYPLGFTPKAEDVEACETMANAGVMERVQVESSERPSFVATAAAVKALGEYAAMMAAGASSN